MQRRRIRDRPCLWDDRPCLWERTSSAAEFPARRSYPSSNHIRRSMSSAKWSAIDTPSCDATATFIRITQQENDRRIQRCGNPAYCPRTQGRCVNTFALSQVQVGTVEAFAATANVSPEVSSGCIMRGWNLQDNGKRRFTALRWQTSPGGHSGTKMEASRVE